MLTDRTKRLAGFWPALIVLLLVLLAAPVPAASPAEDPPLVSYPAIDKTLAGETVIGLSDQVEFTVVVGNELEPSPPLVPVTWYDVRATDVLGPGLTIDNVNVTGDYDDYDVLGNTVVVTATALEPGQYFAFDIQCTIVSFPQPDGIITNTARLDFEYEDGAPEGPLFSETVALTVRRRSFLPVVLRNF
jgi:hypothetical protein